MSEEKKGASFLPRIIEAKTEEDAVNILIDVASALHINQDFNSLRALKDDLDTYSARFKDLRIRLESMSKPYPIEELMDIRFSLSFLLAEMSDSGLIFSVNSAKIQYENAERQVKGEAFLETKNNVKLMEALGSKSVESIKLASGTTDTYKEWARLSSYSYGLFCEQRALTSSIEAVSHAVSTAFHNELVIKKQDIK